MYTYTYIYMYMHNTRLTEVYTLNIYASMFAICGARHDGGPHGGGSGIIFAPVRLTKQVEFGAGAVGNKNLARET
jgi:hypothetical protein